MRNSNQVKKFVAALFLFLLTQVACAGMPVKSMPPVPVKEGIVAFRGYQTWYKIVGDHEEPGKYPLVLLHGGPGVPHDYLESLGAMAATGRRVIFYDQIGCGNSDQPKDSNLYTVEFFKEELANLLQKLGISEFHLLGQSWGGMLALERVLDNSKGVKSMILASSLASMPQWVAETQRLRNELPAVVQSVLDRHEKEGTVQSPEYQEATLEFYRRHVCRLNPWPEPVNRAFAKIGQTVYLKMTGPNEFHITGSLKSWDVRSRLSEIQVPTLITSGKYDEATPLISRTLQQGISGSKWILFEESGHLAHVEEEKRYLEVLTQFLDEVESGMLSCPFFQKGRSDHRCTSLIQAF